MEREKDLAMIRKKSEALAVKLRNGQIIFDSEVQIHAQIIEKYNLDFEDIVSRGFKLGAFFYWKNTENQS